MHNGGVFHKEESGYVCLPISMECLPDGFYLELNCGEKPRESKPTKLSDILEPDADARYSLSARACQGILNRARKRGKELPKELEEALLSQSKETDTGLPIGGEE